MAAGAAEGERRVAAPVEEQERLLAARERRLDPGDRLRRQPAAARRPLAFQVHGRDVGQGRRAEPARQPQPAIAPGLGVDPRLDRGRGGGEHDRRLLEPRAHDAHVAGVVDDAVLLLVGALVLLVDDDQAEIGEGQKQRRARPDDRPRLPARDRAPGPLPLALGQARVPFRRPRAEPRREPVEELGGQRDFRQQHERLPPLPQRLGDRLEIDLRLARAGDAFEQRRGKGAGRDAGGEVVGRGLLVGVEDRRTEVGIEVGCDPLGRQFDERRARRPRRGRRSRSRSSRQLGERGLGMRRGARASAASTRPAPRSCARRLAGRDDAEFLRGRLQNLMGADRHAQHHAARAQRPAGDPVDEVAQRFLQRRPVAHGGDGFQVVAARLARRPDDAGRMARPERHADEGARLEGEVGRGAVAVGGVDRDGTSTSTTRVIAAGSRREKAGGIAAGLRFDVGASAHRLLWAPSQ